MLGIHRRVMAPQMYPLLFSPKMSDNNNIYFMHNNKLILSDTDINGIILM